LPFVYQYYVLYYLTGSLQTKQTKVNMLKKLLFILFLCGSYGFAEQPEEKPWTGHVLRLGLGGVLDLEINLKDPHPAPKGDGHPSSVMIRWGYEYGYQFASGLFLSAELDWTVTYPRNFYIKGQPYSFAYPPISLWYTPMTNIQVGWAFNERWLTTVGLIYYWGLSNSLRYRPVEHFFFEFADIIWMDRVFNTGGFYGGGFDNLHLSMGFGYLF
jgi:hypothetical protein